MEIRISGAQQAEVTASGRARERGGIRNIDSAVSLGVTRLPSISGALGYERQWKV